jgi:hypothetical protein
VLDRFDRRISWRFRGGAERVEDGGCRSCVAGVVEVGGGPSTVLLGGALSLLATFDAALHGAPDLEGPRGAPLRLGVGPRAALRLLPWGKGAQRGGLLAVAAPRWFPGAAEDFALAASVEARVHVGPVSLAAIGRHVARADEALVAVRLFH